MVKRSAGAVRAALTTALGMAVAAFLMFPAVASAANTTTNELSYEFDNGTSWTLQGNTAALDQTYALPSYSDVGLVVDLGELGNLPSTGITATGTGVFENIWLGNSPEAYTPGTHLLSSTTTFSYGAEYNSAKTTPANGTGLFQMYTGKYAGQYLTVADLQKDYPVTTEVYAWVGISFGISGTSSVSGSVSAVNGHAVGNRTLSITNNGDGTVTAVVH